MCFKILFQWAILTPTLHQIKKRKIWLIDFIPFDVVKYVSFLVHRNIGVRASALITSMYNLPLVHWSFSPSFSFRSLVDTVKNTNQLIEFFCASLLYTQMRAERQTVQKQCAPIFDLAGINTAILMDETGHRSWRYRVSSGVAR